MTAKPTAAKAAPAGAIFTVLRAGTTAEAAVPAVTLLLALFVAQKSR
ncbi:hypothetical protein [Candidatus Palauibacter sp.]